MRSINKIVHRLERDSILPSTRGKRWHTSTINQILWNEKYISDTLLQKTYTTYILNITLVKNNDLVLRYYVKDNHYAIISKDIYLQVPEGLGLNQQASRK